jgi:hypothetical protein
MPPELELYKQRQGGQMGNYVFAYRGGGGLATTEAERDAAMAAWGNWFQTLGSAVVDAGNPFGPSTAVSGSGANGGASSALTGYSIVAADSLDAASALAEGCPVLARGGSVDVYETIPIM